MVGGAGGQSSAPAGAVPQRTAGSALALQGDFGDLFLSFKRKFPLTFKRLGLFLKKEK